ncbi:MAG: peptidylprolyl isomerase [Sphingosinicella sp.]|uniref:peptidylprolyl isomerase n=1 Tax=Sphingosinicella sp. TaxID=1917971 RepID=UPI0040384528
MISVNGTVIDEETVGRELQYHPGGSREEAARRAATALVLRELLAERAAALGLHCDEDFEALLEREVTVPEPSEEEIARYYRRNWIRFRTPPLYEAAHIFFPAQPGDDAARAEAKARAEAVRAELAKAPQRFTELARVHSKCASGAEGGSLGQVSRGDTNPEVERRLDAMEPGATECVASRHGWHVLRLDRRERGRELPLDQVRGQIASYLREAVRRRAVSQYLRLLLAGAKIEGLELSAADSLLVQ